jgi:hypothetical protein
MFLKIGAFLLCICMVLEAESAKEEKPMLKIPYRPKEVGHCYERLKEASPVFQKAIEEIQTTLQTESEFNERLQKSMEIHRAAREQGKKEPRRHTWIEEDIYLCCLYDILEAAFAQEAETITQSKEPKEVKEKLLDNLGQSIESLKFGSPQYRTGIKPRFEEKISNARKHLAED